MNNAPSDNPPSSCHTDAAPPLPGGDRPALGDLRRSVSEVTRVLYVRRWMFFVPLCVVMTAAFALSLHVPRRYVCSTTFERRDDPVLVNLPSNEGAGAFVTFRRTLIQDIANPTSLVEVARSLGLAERRGAERGEAVSHEPDAREAQLMQIAGRIGGGLDVRFHQTSEHLDVIEVLYTSNDPETMVNVLNEVRDQYIATTQARINDVLRHTKEWFEEERQKRVAVVEKLEDDLIGFRTAHRGIDPLDPAAASRKLAEASEDLLELERKGKEMATQIEGRREFLSGKATRAPTHVASDLGIGPVQRSPATRRLMVSLASVESEIKELKNERGMTDRHPDIVRLATKRDQLAADLDRHSSRDAVAISVNGVKELLPLGIADLAVDDQLAEARARAEMELRIYEKLLAANELDIRGARSAVTEHEAIQRQAFVRRKEFSGRVAEVDRARSELALYQGYADQVGRVLAAENSQRGILFGKVKPASGSAVPASPRLSTVVVLALTISLTTGVVLVLLSELFDRTIRTRRQVTVGLGLPILESIGEIVSTTVRRRRLLTSMVFTPAVVTALVAMVLLSGSLAYLNLRNRTLYERMITVPQAFLHRVVDGVSEWSPVATSRAQAEEHQS